MNILLWILFGAIVGWLTSLMMGTNAKQGFLGDVVLGVVGALVGGFLSSLMGLPGVSGFNIYSALIAVLGAVVVVVLARAVRGRTA